MISYIGPLFSQHFIGFSLLFGLMVGSFLNVVIHRLPKIMEQEWAEQCVEWQGGSEVVKDEDSVLKTRISLAFPASHCPKCEHRIGMLENIPVLSYLWQRGCCRHCQAPISFRYPLVEIAASALAVAAAGVFGPTWLGIGLMFFLWSLLALAAIDLDTYYLPDAITLPLVWLGLLFNLNGGLVSLKQSVLGAVLGYMVLWSFAKIYKVLRKREGMGHGDFKLLAALGAWLGVGVLPLVIVLSSVVGAVIGSVMILVARGRWEAQIPFGPYLALAGVVALFFSQPIFRWVPGLAIL